MDGKQKENWRRFRRNFFLCLTVGAVLCGIISYGTWGPSAVLWQEGAVLCLALGLWLTEILVAVFTGLKKANPSALALLFLGKIGWWVGLYLGAKNLPAGMEKPVALGIGLFLVALVFAFLGPHGFPRISDGEAGREP